MKHIPILTVISVLNILNGISALTTVYLQDTFRSTIDVDSPNEGYFSSGIIKSHMGSSFKSYNNKTLIFSTKAGCSIQISIRTLDLRPYSADKLVLYDVQNQNAPVYYANLHSYQYREIDSYEVKTYLAPSGKLGVTFTTGAGSTYGYLGFELIYTAQRSWPCMNKEFRCLNNRCISEKLKCDDHNHCGDRSDQLGCSSYSGTGRTIGIVIGSIFLAFAIISVLSIIRRRYSSNTEVSAIVTSHPPPQPLYPPTGQYPAQPGTCYPPPPPPYSQGINNPVYR